MHDDKTTSQNLSRCSKNYRHKEQIHLRHESKAGDQKVQRGIFELCENSAKLQCPHCNSFTEIGIIYCSCGRNLKCKRSPTTTQKAICDYSSIPRLVIERIPVDEQSTVNLNDKSCSAGRSRCQRKQDKRNMASIRRYFQGGTNKKDTESH